MQTYGESVHPPFLSLTSGVSWYQRTAAVRRLPSRAPRCLTKEPKLSRCDLRGSVLPSLSLYVFTKSLSNVPRDVYLTLKCLSFFNNTLFVDQWPFSVALLQFGVYLSLILAIKSFAFETQIWRLLALSVSSVALPIESQHWFCVMVWMYNLFYIYRMGQMKHLSISWCPLLILDLNYSFAFVS